MKQRPVIALLLVFVIIIGYILIQHVQLNAWRREKALDPGPPTSAPSWTGLEEMPPDLLQKAQDSLLSYACLENAEIPLANKTVYGAYLRSGRIIVVLGSIMGHPAVVQVYDRDGNYLMGYSVHFDVKTNVWNVLKTCGKPVVLYGMGDGADKVLSAFERYGIEASAVIASDEFVRGQSFHGFTVKKLSDVEQEFDDFVIALCFASQLPDVMNNIKSVAKAHPLFVPSVPVFGDVIFDDDFVSDNTKNIAKAYELMADGQSKKVFENVLQFYYTGKIELLDEITTEKDEAFKNILSLNDNEVYVDLGAYNGDTIDEFLKYSGGSYRKIIALEPNAKNYEKLKAHCLDMPKIDMWQLGSYSKNTVLTFNNKAGRNSAIAQSGVATRVATVDTILCGSAATYVKADVEGADYETLLGMTNTMKNFKPKLNFSAYHRFEDIFRLPLLINQINPEYKIFLRHHPYIPAWDTNLYCI